MNIQSVLSVGVDYLSLLIIDYYLKMYRWMEVWSYVNDFGVKHWIEEWECVTVVDTREEENYAEPAKSLAAERFAYAVRIPTGMDFLDLVKNYFSVSPKD